MINYLAIIPARSGSKGIINKNIKKINGKECFRYTLDPLIDSNIDKIFFSTDTLEYLKLYNPVQLRWSSASNTNPSYEVHNFGESKGITKDRVLIYPTRTMKDWIKDNSYNLKNEVRAKFYVGLTRSRLSSSIVMDYADDEQFDGVTPLPEVLR